MNCLVKVYDRELDLEVEKSFKGQMNLSTVITVNAEKLSPVKLKDTIENEIVGKPDLNSIEDS